MFFVLKTSSYIDSSNGKVAKTSYNADALFTSN